MKIIADTNVIIGAILLDDQQLKQLLNASTVVAPTLLKAELGNVLLKYVRIRSYPMSDAMKKLSIATALVDEYLDGTSDQLEVLTMASEYNLSYYDAIYIQLSVRTRYPLLTLDKKLLRVADSLGLRFQM